MGRFINADAFVTTGTGLLGNNMFAYCNNNPIRFSDPTGHAIWGTNTVAIKDGSCGLTPGSAQYILNYFENRKRIADTIDSIMDVGEKVLRNIQVSTGKGYGLYGSFSVLGFEMEGGFYANEIATDWQNGISTFYQDWYVGATGTILYADFGGQLHTITDGYIVVERDNWFLYDKHQSTITLLGGGLYTPNGGGRFEVSLDCEGLYRDLGWIP